MAATSDIGVLLRFYAGKQNSPFVSHKDFVDYLKRYAQHNIEETPDLAAYLGNPIPQLEKALEPFIESKQIVMLDADSSKKNDIRDGIFQYGLRGTLQGNTVKSKRAVSDDSGFAEANSDGSSRKD